LSGRGGAILERRARELGVHEVMLKRVDKDVAFAELLARTGLDPARIAYVGDDLLDVPVLRRVGFAATVPQARREVFAAVHHVTTAAAGFGAVRDVVELLMQARGSWRDVVNRYETS
jgi:3-deoxy-D-manno-octulosonate 8-phosphate phosphatase (KDO 8-P phosphatase)